MLTFLPVLRVLGGVTMIFSASMLLPLLVSWLSGEPEAARHAYPMGILLTVGGGFVLWLVGGRGRGRELIPRDGILLVVSVWTLLPLFACIPLLVYFQRVGAPISFTDAYFETMSGLTTTGSTVLVQLQALPASINLWRCFLQWMGGMGILVLAVAILPLIGVGGSQLFRAESAGPIKDTKLTPRITETAKGLWSVYAGLSVLCVLSYRLGGMSWMDAFAHMFSTMSLGGLSSYDESFSAFRSPLLEWICVVFMLLASCNFALYFLALRKRSVSRFLCDPEARGTLGVLVGASLLVAAFLMSKGVYSDPAEALRQSFFNVVSIGSTTGYSTTDYNQWPVFAPILMLLLSGIATSAGSTGAGIKMVRMIILLKQAKREIQRTLHPRAINPVLLGGRVVSNYTIFSILAFMLFYGASTIVLTLVLCASGMAFDTALSAIVASVNNMGPGLNEIGPAGNYQSLTDFQTWICTFSMLLGRLELLSVLALFTPQFWRK